MFRHGFPPYPARRREDAAAVLGRLGTRPAPLRVSRPVVRIHVRRAGRALWRCGAWPNHRRPLGQRCQPVCHAGFAQHGHHHGFFGARRPDDGHTLRRTRPRRRAVSDGDRKTFARGCGPLAVPPVGPARALGRLLRPPCAAGAGGRPRAHRGSTGTVRAPHRARDRRPRGGAGRPGHAGVHRRHR
ncbi:hypothetical protein D3C71_1540810 [compost metagenome]